MGGNTRPRVSVGSRSPLRLAVPSFCTISMHVWKVSTVHCHSHAWTVAGVRSCRIEYRTQLSRQHRRWLAGNVPNGLHRQSCSRTMTMAGAANSRICDIEWPSTGSHDAVVAPSRIAEQYFSGYQATTQSKVNAARIEKCRHDLLLAAYLA